MLFFPSPYEQLERAEQLRARQAGRGEYFGRPTKRRSWFARVLRFGAFAVGGYFVARWLLGREPISELENNLSGAAGDRLVEEIRRAATNAIDAANQSGVLQRQRPTLAAGMGVQSAGGRLRETLRLFFTRHQFPYVLTQQQQLEALQRALEGTPYEGDPMAFIRQLGSSDVLDELFATRTRRRMLLNTGSRSMLNEQSLGTTLATSKAFRVFRRRLQEGLGLSEEQTARVIREALGPALHETLLQSQSAVEYNTQQVLDEFRRRYLSAISGENTIENTPIAEFLSRHGYRPATLREALGFGYTVNDPRLARALQYVRPEHWQYLDIEADPSQFPEEIQRAIQNIRSQINDPNRDENWDPAVDADPILSLARFLVLRQPHLRDIVLRSFDLVGRPRPRTLRGIVRLSAPGPERERDINNITFPEEMRELLNSITIPSLQIRQNPASGESGQIIDLTYFDPYVRHEVQRLSSLGLPLAPGIFSLQLLRMFPWYRPADDWFIHIDSTARQPILADALGRRRDQPIGSDVFILGNAAFRIDPSFYFRSTPGQATLPEPDPRQVAPSVMGGVRATLQPIEGEWTAMRVRGMSMRGMMDALIQSGAQRPPNWLRFGDQGEPSWFEKLSDTLFGQERPELDVRRHWQQFQSIIQEGGEINQELAAELQDILGRVSYRIHVDPLTLIRHYGEAILSNPSIPETSSLRAWGEVFQRLGEADNIEEALAMFLRSDEFRHLRGVLLGMGDMSMMTSSLMQQAERFGLVQRSSLGVGYVSTVQTGLLQNLIQMRSSLYRYITEPYTPDQPEHLLGAVPGAIFGTPDQSLRFEELLRAFVAEAFAQHAVQSQDLGQALTTMVSNLPEEVRARAGAWLLSSVLSDQLGDERVRDQLVSYMRSAPPVVQESFDWLSREVIRQHSFPYVNQALEEDPDEVRNLATYFVMRQGPALGSREWLTGYLTRWGRVENTSDLYRYFVGWRLNEMLKPYGLGLSRSELGSGGSILGGLVLYRFLPAVAGYMAWRYLNTEMRFTLGYAPADFLADTMRGFQYMATGAMDVLGVTSLKKWLVSEIPGLDLYFTPRNLQELRDYYTYGSATIRYGRGWLSGSRSLFPGEGVQANVPPWTRGMRSYWQAARNADIAPLAAYSRGDIPLPTLRNPLAPIFYIYRKLTGEDIADWAERHRYDRPYPQAFSAAEIEEQVSPFSLAGVAIGRRRGLPIGRGGVAGTVVGAAPVGGGAVGGGEGPSTGINYRSFMLGAGLSPRLREELVTPPGAEGGGYVAPLTTGSAFESIRVTGRNIFHHASEIQGLYGWMQKIAVDTILDREPSIILDNPRWATSFSRRFWESLYGGVDILPWHNELNELLRRFVPKRRPSEYVVYNPIPNNMPYWVPERFRYGDPYVRILAGELRLPGEAYRWANPARFGRTRPGPHDIRQSWFAMLPVDYIGGSRSELFAAAAGLEEAAGLPEPLKDEVKRRVLRRFSEELEPGELTYMEVVGRNLPHHLTFDTMLWRVSKRELVHPVSADMDPALAEAAMQVRMHMLGAKRGRILFVDDEDEGTYYERIVRYRRSTALRAIREWDRFYEQLIRGVESGELQEGLFYSPLQRLEILADIAPSSPQFRHVKAYLNARQSMLTDVEKKRYELALQVAERTRQRIPLYARKNVALDSERRRILSIDEEGRMLVAGLEDPMKLAGVRLRIGEIKRRYGLPRTASAEEAMRRLSEELGLRGEATLQYIPARRGMTRAIVIAHGRNINRFLLRHGLAVPDEEDVSPAARRLRQGPIRRLWNWLIDTITHADTPLHTKFLRVRTPLEEWERGHVFGTHSGSWESPLQTYVFPTITSIANKGPIRAAVAGSIFGALFGQTVGAKSTGALVGAAAGAGLSLLRTLLFPRGYIPSRVRKRWEIDEYIDALQYVKFMRLYQQEAKLAKREEGVDVDRLLEEMRRAERRASARRERLRRRMMEIHRRLEKRYDSKLVAELERIREQLKPRRSDDEEDEEEAELTGRRRRRRRRGMWERLMDRILRRHRRALSPYELGEHSLRALMYRAMAEQTARGTGRARTIGEGLRSVRPQVKDIYRRILEEGTAKEKRRFYDLLPDYQKLLFHDLLAPKEPLPKPPDPTRLFRKFGLPGPSWRGWDPDVDLELLRGQLMKQRGLDPIDAGVYPTEQVVAERVFEDIGVPLPIRYREDVRRQLETLLGEKSWQFLTGATSTTKVGGNLYVYIDYYDREYERNVYRHYVRSLSQSGVL